MNELSKSRDLRDVVSSIHEHQRFLVATHVRPDGDAVGAVLATAFMLRKLGKKADPYCQDSVPPGHEFLAGVELITYEPPAASNYDAAILVDCGEFSRVGSELADTIGRIPFIINIDHHISKEPFGNVYWVDPSASSTCEMLYGLCEALPVALDPEIATQLYTGILTDTGSFRFSNTTRRVLETATSLVAAGAQPAFIAEQVYDSDTPQRLLLLARVLSTVMFYSGDRLATAELTRRMLMETGTSVADSEGFINHLRSVRQVEMAMVFREEKDGMTNVSMRSKGSADVASFAQKYGGGGHRHAAAFRVPGTLETIRAEYTKQAMNYLANSSKRLIH
ncbi:MAG: bifunctional oligoribonuclease/PAP phosphatase NrnA [Syntrophobacteraceae bacterium]